MRILIISFEFPPEGGGIGTYAYQNAKNLHLLGLQVTALVLTSKLNAAEIEKFDRNQNFEIVRYKNIHNKLFFLTYRIIKALYVINKKKFDLIYIAHMPAGIIGLLGKVIFRIPYIIIGHGTEILFKARMMYTKLVYWYSDLIIVNSNYTKKLFEQKNISNKIEVVSPGGDHIIFNPENIDENDLRNRLGLAGKFILLSVGSLTERKDHATVLIALKLIINTCPDLYYLIVGDGPLRNYLLNLIEKLELASNVRLCGFAQNQELVTFYKLCDLFILNSKIDKYGDVEGFGIVLIEANLMGKAVIGIKNTGMEEAIEDGKSGLLVQMNDPKDTARAIKLLYSDQQMLASMGQYGKKRALEKFTWIKCAEKTKEHITKILNQENLLF